MSKRTLAISFKLYLNEEFIETISLVNEPIVWCYNPTENKTEINPAVDFFVKFLNFQPAIWKEINWQSFKYQYEHFAPVK